MAPGRRRSPLVVVAAVCVLALLLAAAGVRHFVTQPYRVPSASMAPTLRAGDVILADRASRGQAQRGDVVVFDGTGYFAPSAESGGRYWVKRVIAVGGERVTCCSDSGALMIDGQELDEPYLAPGTEPSAIEFDLEVPDGRMFVLGDNRADSTDSRSMLGAPGGGMVPVERVVGTVDRIVWPLTRAGAVR